MKVGVLGASGYAGVELLRLCAAHPDFDVAVATAGGGAGQRVAVHTPSLSGAYPDLEFSPAGIDGLDGLDLVFSALPHGQSQQFIADLDGRIGTFVDLAADFRLTTAGAYATWYGDEHQEPSYLDRFVYGLPELTRAELAGAPLIAAAGCYPTAATIALAPLVSAGLVERDRIVVDAASGISGAGRGTSEHLQFGQVDENFTAYGLLNHRHTAEIEQNLGVSALFTPHLAPMVRGILATCYARPASATTLPSTDDALAVLHDAYDAETFIVVTADVPSTKATAGSNCAHVTVRVDPRTGWVLALCAIDNRVKGAAGQAIQCANLSLGLKESTGLPIAGMWP